ncbi:MAG: hypothetical protein II333_06460, partial [Clostridia bacterium]|nr:hypothetical protein [Clostridia bacterium]
EGPFFMGPEHAESVGGDDSGVHDAGQAGFVVFAFDNDGDGDTVNHVYSLLFILSSLFFAGEFGANFMFEGYGRKGIRLFRFHLDVLPDGSFYALPGGP